MDDRDEDLPGLQIYYSMIDAPPGSDRGSTGGEGEAPPPRSDFSILFGPFLLDLDAPAWVLGSDAFDPNRLDPMAEARLQEFLQVSRVGDAGYVVRQAGFLSTYAFAIRDDWNRLCGLCPQTILDRAGVEALLSDGGSDLIPWDHVRVIFDNHDGAYWAVYVRDADLLGRIRAHVESLSRCASDLRIESASFQECAREQDRQWRDYQARWLGGGGSV